MQTKQENSLDIVDGYPHSWIPYSGIKKIECKYCRKLIFGTSFTCEVCSFPIHKHCMMKSNIPSCSNVAPYQLKERSRLSSYLEKRPPKIHSKSRSVISRSNWQKRWFILTKECNIYYFKDMNSLKAKGVISLVKYTTVDTLFKRKIRLYNENDSSIREYYLRADTEKTQKIWVDTINKYMKRAKEDKVQVANTLHTGLIDSKLSTNSCEIFRKLKIRISEGRNFKSPSLSVSSLPSIYCIISCGYDFYRTLTKWNDKNPIWDEEFELVKFNKDGTILKCYVVEEDILLTDYDIGIINIPLDDINISQNYDKWYKLSKPIQDRVTGHIHLQIEKIDSNLQINILECKNLAAQDPNGLSDPYVTIKYGNIKKKTKIIKKTLNPFFGESFKFIWDDSIDNIEVYVWDWDLVGSNDFLGQIIIPTNTIDINNINDKCYLLESRNKESEPLLDTENIGEIRLRFCYSELIVHPLTSYLGLMGLLMEDGIPFIKLIHPIIIDKSSMANILVKIFDANMESIRYISELLTMEITTSDTPQILFRGNTLVTKSVDIFMKYAGVSYLRFVLGPLLTEINESKQSYEIDPLKVSSVNEISKNMKILEKICQKFMQRIIDTSSKCPIVMQYIFYHIRSTILKKYEKQSITAKYTAVSAFIFLRFFVPAIMNPRGFGLLELVHPLAARTFTLVAKVLQNLANLIEFGEKEPFMNGMNNFIVDNIETMKLFLNKISAKADFSQINIGISSDIWLAKELALFAEFMFIEEDKIESQLQDTTTLLEYKKIIESLKISLQEY